MSEEAGDIAVVLSSELIAKITQEYFNKVMFKQKVEIVDLKPASDGYMFSVAFVKDTTKVIEVVKALELSPSSIANEAIAVAQRAGNGRFAKKEKV